MLVGKQQPYSTWEGGKDDVIFYDICAPQLAQTMHSLSHKLASAKGLSSESNRDTFNGFSGLNSFHSYDYNSSNATAVERVHANLCHDRFSMTAKNKIDDTNEYVCSGGWRSVFAITLSNTSWLPWLEDNSSSLYEAFVHWPHLDTE